MPDQLLVANVDPVAYQMEGYKNSGLVVILQCLNSFQHNKYVTFSLLYVLLRENYNINTVCFPSFHNCYLSRNVKCDVDSGRENQPVSRMLGI